MLDDWFAFAVSMCQAGIEVLEYWRDVSLEH